MPPLHTARRRLTRFDLAALVVLLAVGAAWWRDELAAPSPHYDEAVYLEAFRQARGGEFPVAVRHPSGRFEPYLYLPSFTRLGALAVATVGEPWTLRLLRGANLLGAGALVWLAVAGRRWPAAVRLLAALAALTLSPLVGHGFAHGNVTLAAGALALCGLRLADGRPAWGGLLLGAGLAVKPVVGAAPWMLLAQPGEGARRRRLAAAVAIVVTAAAVWLAGAAALPDLLRSGGRTDLAHNVSFARAAYCFGWTPSPAWFAAAALAAGLVATRRLRLAGDELLALAATVSVLALPQVWSHTLSLTLPLQALALERGWERVRAATGTTRRWRGLELAVIAAAVLSVQGARGVGAARDWPLPAQGLVTLIPLAALGLLAAAALLPCRPAAAPPPAERLSAGR